MREIILDTETTGLNKNKDRVIEIGCVEVIDKKLTGKHFHVYLNPEDCIIPPEVVAVHGLTNERLKDEPLFAEIAGALLEFLQDSQIVAHNAFFDVNFLNAELERLSLPIITVNRVFDTLALARRTFVGQQNSLDVLCKRYGIDNSHRTLHGALLDAEILYEVYLKLTGANQGKLGFEKHEQDQEAQKKKNRPAKQRPIPLPSRLTPQEAQAHAEFVAQKLGAEALWNHYSARSRAEEAIA